MPYQQNYAEDIGNIATGGLAKIEETIFRFASPNDEIVSKVVADGELGLDLNNEFLELHFYTRGTNELVKSVVIPLSENYLQFRDSARRRHHGDTAYETLQLGLELWNPENPETSLYSKYLSDLGPGTYNLIINFFSKDLGQYTTSTVDGGQQSATNWKIAQISGTRQELILEPISTHSFNQTQFQQFVDTSIFAKDFKYTLVHAFETYKPFDENKYETLMNNILEQLRLDTLTWNYIEENHREQVEDVLRNVVKDIFGEIKTWVDGEIEAKRFRITDNNFQAVLGNKIGAVLGSLSNTNSYLSKFPENGQLFLNQ
jgi:hypothetical protein